MSFTVTVVRQQQQLPDVREMTDSEIHEKEVEHHTGKESFS